MCSSHPRPRVAGGMAAVALLLAGCAGEHTKRSAAEPASTSAAAGTAPPPAVAGHARTGFLMLEVADPALRTIGSAVMVAPGLAATNRHVVEQARGRAIVAVRADSARLPVTVAAYGRREDVALLRVAPDGLAPLPFAPRLDGGLWVLGAAERVAHVQPATLTHQRFSLEGFGQGFMVRVPHAAPGFSGGPVIDGGGNLVGLVAAGCAVRTSADGPALARLAAGLPGPAPDCLRHIFALDVSAIERLLEVDRSAPSGPET